MINTKRATMAVTLVFGLSGPSLSSNVVPVSSTGNLYLAGQPSGLHCCYSDSSPAESPMPAPIALTSGEVLTFSATGSAAHQPGPAYATPDGDLLGDYSGSPSPRLQVPIAGSTIHGRGLRNSSLPRATTSFPLARTRPSARRSRAGGKGRTPARPHRRRERKFEQRREEAYPPHWHRQSVTVMSPVKARPTW